MSDSGIWMNNRDRSISGPSKLSPSERFIDRDTNLMGRWLGNSNGRWFAIIWSYVNDTWPPFSTTFIHILPFSPFNRPWCPMNYLLFFHSCIANRPTLVASGLFISLLTFSFHENRSSFVGRLFGALFRQLNLMDLSLYNVNFLSFYYKYLSLLHP